jgi:hypothetical protein
LLLLFLLGIKMAIAIFYCLILHGSCLSWLSIQSIII